MSTSFKQYFHNLYNESEIESLRTLLAQIDDAIETANKTNTNDFEPRYVEFISKKVGELYDAITQQNLRLPADMQGDAGDRPQHLDTLNRLKGMVNAESTLKQLDEIINIISEQRPTPRKVGTSQRYGYKHGTGRQQGKSIADFFNKPADRDSRYQNPAYSQQKSVDTTPLVPGKKDFSTPFDIDPGSKVAGSYFKDTRSSRNNPAAPAPKPTPMDSSVKPEPKPFGRVDHRMGPHARRLAAKGQGPRQPVGKIPIGDVPGKIAAGLKGFGKKLVGKGTPLSSKGRSRQLRGFTSRR